MLFSVAYLVVRRLLSCLIVLARSEVSNDNTACPAKGYIAGERRGSGSGLGRRSAGQPGCSPDEPFRRPRLLTSGFAGTAARSKRFEDRRIR